MEKKTSGAAVLALLCLLLSSVPVWAAADGTLEIKTVVEKEQMEFNEEGRKVLVRKPAAEVIPGDEVIYTTYYKNTGEDPAEKIVLTNPIPENMIYTMGSAAGKGCVITFSVDNGKTYNSFEALRVTGNNGAKRPPKASELTHIRWTVSNPLPSDQTGTVSYRATLQ